jgi:SAM-dependent methyltransferase
MDRNTIRAYDNTAIEYEAETADFWSRFPSPFFTRFLSKVNGRVIDLGCGFGRDSLAFRARGAKPVCVDASVAMARSAAAFGLLTVQADFSRLPFLDEAFDCAWAYCSFVHIRKSELSVALAELRRVLKPGGIVGLGMLDGNGEGYRPIDAAGLFRRWFSRYRLREVIDALAGNGLAVSDSSTMDVHSNRYLNIEAQAV